MLIKMVKTLTYIRKFIPSLIVVKHGRDISLQRLGVLHRILRFEDIALLLDVLLRYLNLVPDRR